MMTLKSMTGFARQDGRTPNLAWHWELRSVNGRGLDVRLRLPPGFESLEPAIRDHIGKQLKRGSLSVSLAIARQSQPNQIRLNEAALEQVIAAAKRVCELTGAPPASAEGLLAVKGVLEVCDEAPDEDAIAQTQKAMLQSFVQALEDLIAARAQEGARLATVIAAQMTTVEALVGQIETSPARTPEAIAVRLKENVARLVEACDALDDARLHQEAVMLATRADVEEELRRLRMHIAAARELLAGPGPAGRRLDFLAQEFNREANTLCSKANDPQITKAGLELKVVIDQMREQVQNIE